MKQKSINRMIFLCILLQVQVILSTAYASNAREQAEVKMSTLADLIDEAEAQGVQTLKERTALRTAEIFMTYADWDEQHVAENTAHYSLVARYQDEASKYANLLPDFEREEIVKMMDSSLVELRQVMDGEIHRLPSPAVDWARTEIVGDAILFEGKPVFLNDWTWKPSIPLYNEYHGHQDGYFLTPTHVKDAAGNVAPYMLNELKSKDDGSMGFVFFNHTNVPTWAKEQDPTIVDGPGTKYTMYDINNPLARDIQRKLIKSTVPLMAGKQYTALGYMLCNEPHWNTIEGEWAANEISDKALEDFKAWLEVKHQNISTLNTLWGKNYASFDAIDCPKIMQASMQGTPMYFDFMTYNMERVTDWFRFMRDEIKKYDPQARTHIKLMPNLWSNNKRDSGIDMEALTYDSGIIGHDAGSCGAWMYGKPHAWETYYSFDWIELCMASDFYKSVSPEKIMFNTEGHYLSTVHTRDLYMTKEYARLNYWMAYVFGLTAQQTWYWCRREDGSSRENDDDNGYAGSNNHQPRVVNEVHQTLIDLNSVSNYIMAMQRQRKSIRVYYTKASSINKKTHMDDIFATYEHLFFEGASLGFATHSILEKQDHDQWNTIVVTKTPYVFEADMVALQAYLDAGGTVIVDSESLKTDEYGRPLEMTLNAGSGNLIQLNSVQAVCDKALELMHVSSDAPALMVEQNNGMAQKTCVWKVVDGVGGSQILNIANFGKTVSTIKVRMANGQPVESLTNVLTGETIESEFVLPVYGLLLLEINGQETGNVFGNEEMMSFEVGDSDADGTDGWWARNPDNWFRTSDMANDGDYSLCCVVNQGEGKGADGTYIDPWIQTDDNMNGNTDNACWITEIGKYVLQYDLYLHPEKNAGLKSIYSFVTANGWYPTHLNDVQTLPKGEWITVTTNVMNVNAITNGVGKLVFKINTDAADTDDVLFYIDHVRLADTSAVDVPIVLRPLFNVCVANGALYIDGVELGSHVYVYDLNGCVQTHIATTHSETIVVPAARGAYIVKVGEEVKKVVV